MTGRNWGKKRVQIGMWTLWGALLLGPVAAPAQVLFEDNFDSLAAKARPARDTWAIGGAIDEDFWFGDNGSLNTGNLDNTPSPLNIAFVNRAEAKEWTDVSVRATFQMLQPDGVILLAARQQDFSNHYLAKLTSVPGNGGAVNHIAELIVVQRGVVKSLASKGQGGSGVDLPDLSKGGQTNTIELRVVGNQLSLIVNDKELLTATDSNSTFPKGSVGIGAASTQILFDRVTVTKAAGVRGNSDPAPAGDGNWRLMAASGLTREEADKLRQEMIDSSQAEVKEVNGSWSIFVGRYATQQAAEADKQKVIEREGFFSVEVIEDAPAAAAGPQRFLVQAGVFDTPAEAEAVRAKLEESQGIFMFDTVQEGGKTRLTVGMPFEDRPEAEKFAAQIRSDAPAAAVVAEAGQGRTALPIDEKGMSTLSEKDRQAAQVLIERLNQGAANADEQRALDQQFRDSNRTVQDYVRQQQEMARKQAETERTAQERNALATEVSRLIENKRWNEAQSRLIRLKQIDGGNPFWDKLLGDVQKGIAEDRAKPRTVDPTPLSPQDRLAALVESAKQAEAKAMALPEDRRTAGLDEARRLWLDVQRTATDSVNRELASEALQRINTLASGVGGSTDGEQKSSGSMLYIILGALVLVVGGVVAFFLLGKKKSAPQPAKAAPAPSPSTMTPLPTAMVTPLPTASPAATKTPLPATSARTPLPVAQPTPLPKGNVQQPVPQVPAQAPPPAPGGNLRIAPGVVLPAGSAPPDTVLPPVSASDTPAIPGVLSNLPPPTPIPATPVNIPDTQPPTSSSGEVHLPDTAPPLHTTPPSGVVPVAADDYLVQNFDDEAVGSVPKNWRGTYDYASIAVVDRPEGGRCMRFEKKTGSGSAYFACRFPDAGGKVLVEFDLKCEDKNKYLLGFYIEKDEDFRHSIHTVVHKDAGKGDKVTLRLQNESAPYALGEWVKVRFHIDLTRHLVDGYVNDKPVAIGVRLVSRPKVVNTLSIRDNLLTEGVLYIDNIRITRDR